MADTNTPRSRRWFITIMNPEAHGLTRETIIALLTSLSPLYFCFAYEKAPKTSMEHVHVTLCFEHARAFSSLKSKLPTANIQAMRGSISDCLAYIRKCEDENTESTFYENGEAPSDRAKSTGVPKSFQILEAIKAGASDLEIMEAIPGAIYQARNLDVLRQALIKERYENEFRSVEVVYISGPTAAGKTRYVYAQAEKPSMVYRITSYKRGLLYDGYLANDILCLDEFSSAHVPIRELLSLADGHPLMLPARYADKVAAYSKLFLVSNLPLDRQYRYEQAHEPMVWAALLRRLTSILELQHSGIIIDRTADYKKEDIHNEKFS